MFYHWGCTSIYLSMSYPFRSLVAGDKDENEDWAKLLGINHQEIMTKGTGATFS